jgi:hypothetical protein
VTHPEIPNTKTQASFRSFLWGKDINKSMSTGDHAACGWCRTELSSIGHGVCGGCHSVNYCGAVCQRRHWKLHAPRCREARVDCASLVQDVSLVSSDARHQIELGWDDVIDTTQRCDPHPERSGCSIGMPHETPGSFAEASVDIQRFLSETLAIDLKAAGDAMTMAIRGMLKDGGFAFADAREAASKMWSTIRRDSEKRGPGFLKLAFLSISDAFSVTINSMLNRVKGSVSKVVATSVNAIRDSARSIATLISKMSSKVATAFSFLTSGRMGLDLPSHSMKKIHGMPSLPEKKQQQERGELPSQDEGGIKSMWDAISATAALVSDVLGKMHEAFIAAAASAIRRAIGALLRVITSPLESTKGFVMRVNAEIIRLVHFAVSMCAHFPRAASIPSEVKSLAASVRDAIAYWIDGLEIVWTDHIRPAFRHIMQENEAAWWYDGMSEVVAGLKVIGSAISGMASMGMLLLGELMKAIAENLGDAIAIPFGTMCYGKEPIDLAEGGIGEEMVFDPDLLLALATELKYQRTGNGAMSGVTLVEGEAGLWEIAEEMWMRKEEMKSIAFAPPTDDGKPSIKDIADKLWKASNIAMLWSHGLGDDRSLLAEATALVDGFAGRGFVSMMEKYALLGARLAAGLWDVVEKIAAADEAVISAAIGVVSRGMFVDATMHVGSCIDDISGETWMSRKSERIDLGYEVERVKRIIRRAKAVGLGIIAANESGDWKSVHWIYRWMRMGRPLFGKAKRPAGIPAIGTLQEALALRFCALGLGGIEASMFSAVVMETTRRASLESEKWAVFLRSADEAVRSLDPRLFGDRQVRSKLVPAIVGLWNAATSNQFVSIDDAAAGQRPSLKGIDGSISIGKVLEMMRKMAVSITMAGPIWTRMKGDKKRPITTSLELDERIRRSIETACALTMRGRDPRSITPVELSQWISGAFEKRGAEEDWRRLAKKATPPVGVDPTDWAGTHAMLCWLWGSLGCDVATEAARATAAAAKASIEANMYDVISALLSVAIGPGAAAPIMLVAGLLFAVADMYSACREVKIISPQDMVTSISGAFGVRSVYEVMQGSVQALGASMESYKSPALGCALNLLCTLLPTHVDSFPSEMLVDAI